MNARKLGPTVILSVTLVGALLLSSQIAISDSLVSAESTAEVLPLSPVPRTYLPSLPTTEPVLYVDPSKYRIVCVATNPDQSDRFYAVDGLLASTTQAVIAETWEEVRELDRIEPIEALIIHPSAFEDADLNWTAAASRRGVTLFLLNMYVEQMATLRNSICMSSTVSKYPDRFRGIASH